VLVISGIMPSHADTPKPLNWVDPTPSALQPFDGNAELLADLAGDKMLFYPQPKQTVTLPYSKGPKTYANVQYMSGAVVVAASAEQVGKLLTDYNNYDKLYPKMTASKVEAQEQVDGKTLTVAKYHLLVKIPFPFLTFDEDVLLQHDQRQNSISTLVLDSPIQYGAGRFEWFGLKNGKTLVTLTQWGDLDRPKGFLVSTILRALPEAKLGIPSGVEGFVLESLRQRFNPDGSPSVTPNTVVPAMTLNPAQETLVIKLLQQGGVVQFNHRPIWLNMPKGAEKLWFVSSYAQVPVTLEQAKDAYMTPAHYPEIYRQVSKVTTVPAADGSLQNDIKIAIGLGILSIPMHLNLNFKPESDQSVRFVSTGSDVEFMQGRYTLKSLGTKSTLVGITATGKLGEHPPLLLRLGKYLPYADYLPVVGTAPVLFDKSRIWLIKQDAKTPNKSKS
jgi:ribosome-associated toxin RatA of RatAB toxin-antitoxin module